MLPFKTLHILSTVAMIAVFSGGELLVAAAIGVVMSPPSLRSIAWSGGT